MTIQEALMKVRDEYLAFLMKDGFFYLSKKRHDATTWDINCGYCEDFANEVCDIFPEAETFDLGESDNPESFFDYAHTAVRYNSRYYDAECIEGVPDWKMLPIVKNKGKTRTQVLKERLESTLEGKE
jgi:hypothetical protein